MVCVCTKCYLYLSERHYLSKFIKVISQIWIHISKSSHHSCTIPTPGKICTQCRGRCVTCCCILLLQIQHSSIGLIRISLERKALQTSKMSDTAVSSLTVNGLLFPSVSLCLFLLWSSWVRSTAVMLWADMQLFKAACKIQTFRSTDGATNQCVFPKSVTELNLCRIQVYPI